VARPRKNKPFNLRWIRHSIFSMERQMSRSERMRKLLELLDDDDDNRGGCQVGCIEEQIRKKQEEVSCLEKKLRQTQEKQRLLEEARRLKEAEAPLTDSMLPSTFSVTNVERTDDNFCGPCERKLTIKYFN